MVPRTAFINKIRALGYSYKSQQKRTQMYRKKGSTHCIFVPLSDLLEEEYVDTQLSQAGVPKDEAKAFFASYSQSAKPS